MRCQQVLVIRDFINLINSNVVRCIWYDLYNITVLSSLLPPLPPFDIIIIKLSNNRISCSDHFLITSHIIVSSDTIVQRKSAIIRKKIVTWFYHLRNDLLSQLIEFISKLSTQWLSQRNKWLNNVDSQIKPLRYRYRKFFNVIFVRNKYKQLFFLL